MSYAITLSISDEIVKKIMQKTKTIFPDSEVIRKFSIESIEREANK